VALILASISVNTALPPDPQQGTEVNKAAPRSFAVIGLARVLDQRAASAYLSVAAHTNCITVDVGRYRRRRVGRS